MKPQGRNELAMTLERWAVAMGALQRGFVRFAHAAQAALAPIVRVVRDWNDEADAAAECWSPEIPGGVARQGVLALVAAARRKRS